MNRPSSERIDDQDLYEKVQKPMTFVNSFWVIMVRKYWVFCIGNIISYYVVNIGAVIRVIYKLL